MSLRTRFSAAAAVCATLAVFTLACGGGAPASPTAAGQIPVGTTVVPSSAVPAIAGTTTWSCFTGSRTGIFGADSCKAAIVIGGQSTGAAGRIGAAADNNPLSASVSGTTVTLTWQAPPGQTVATYVVQAGLTPGASDVANFDTGNTLQ